MKFIFKVILVTTNCDWKWIKKIFHFDYYNTIQSEYEWTYEGAQQITQSTDWHHVNSCWPFWNYNKKLNQNCSWIQNIKKIYEI